MWIHGGEGGTNRSRGNFLPLLLILSAAFGPPPCRAIDILYSRSFTSSSIACDLAWNSGEVVDMREGNTDAW
jgi:hypothetical protein